MKKIKILGIDGKKAKEMEFPSIFQKDIREDIVAKVLEAKKRKQPYAPSPVAGKQHSASGIIIHRRKVWKSGYGRGASRIPRKILSRRGSQFNWEGATVPSAVGGLRAHPPKIASMVEGLKINKRELKIAFLSSLSATINKEKIIEKYETIQEKDLTNIPLVVESKFDSLKTKDLVGSIRKILGDDLYEKISKKKKVRSGRGKMRGRRYKNNAGLLIVVGKDEKLKTKMFDVKNVDSLNVTDLAKGGLGRVTLYTEKAVKELENKFGETKK